AGEDLAEALPLAEDRDPGQAGLEAFEAQLLEQPRVGVDRAAPLVVVVRPVEGVVARPPAPDGAVVVADQALGQRGRCTVHRLTIGAPPLGRTRSTHALRSAGWRSTWSRSTPS